MIDSHKTGCLEPVRSSYIMVIGSVYLFCRSPQNVCLNVLWLINLLVILYSMQSIYRCNILFDDLLVPRQFDILVV